MNRGIYIMANDRATENAVALLNSIRAFDSDTPIVLIPYDAHSHEVITALTRSHKVQVYQDLQLIERLTSRLRQIFGRKFFPKPDMFRKQACWFGPFDQFLYLDADIVVFEKIIDVLHYLSDYDFVCCDYQHSGGIKDVFTSKVTEDKIFSTEQLKDVFNGGFWGSRRNLISERDLYDTFEECASHPEYFDYSNRTSDQPILNYLVLKRIPRRTNLVRLEDKGPGSWAGSPHFRYHGHQLIDPNVNRPLKYLHWAGMRIEPGCPYWDIWKYYRSLTPPIPPH